MFFNVIFFLFYYQEESAWMVNDEVERLTCQSNNLSIDGSTNNGNGNDLKQKNH